MLAAMLADLLWCVFLIVGLEHVQFQAGHGAANYLISSDIVMSHSLAMDGLWAALLAGFYWLVRRYAYNPQTDTLICERIFTMVTLSLLVVAGALAALPWVINS